MKYIRKTEEIYLNQPTAITLGKFESLHRGHCSLIDRVLEQKKEGKKTVVFTFATSPAAKMENRKHRGILTNEERRCILEKKGLDILIEYPFNEGVRHMSAEHFVREILVKRLRAANVVVGPDYHFGYQRKGNPELLRKMGKELGFEVQILKKEQENGRDISSTYIREELQNGNVEKAGVLLGYPYFVQGKILHGRELGRKLGVPTINQIPEDTKLLPLFGVYATKTTIGGKAYYGISNVGVKPTVNGDFAGVETYLFNCSGDLYGQEAYVEFLRFLRPEKRFENLTLLKTQIFQDIRKAQQFFTSDELL